MSRGSLLTFVADERKHDKVRRSHPMSRGSLLALDDLPGHAAGGSEEVTR